MSNQTTPKTLAWIGIPLFVAAILAIINSLSQGFLWEIPNSRSNYKTSEAAFKAAEAAATDAINKLQAAIESAKGVTEASRLQAQATVTSAGYIAKATTDAAQRQAEGLYRATAESVRAENTQFDQVFKPLISDPAEKMARLNQEIVALEHELRSGFYPDTRLLLMPAAIVEKTAEKAAREEELSRLTETNQKNWKTVMGMISGVTGEVMGELGSLYPSGNERAPKMEILQKAK